MTVASKPVKTQIANLAKKLEKAVKETFSKNNMELLGNQILSDIVTRTRLGYGFEEINGPKKKLAPLSFSYRDFRAGRAAFYTDKSGRIRKYKPERSQKPKLDSTTRPSKSNLTLTGDMLRSITYKQGSLGFGKTLTFFSGDRKNAEKVGYAHDGSTNRAQRKFLGLTKQEITKIRNRVELIYSANLKKFVGG
jgi:hypothetical protein